MQMLHCKAPVCFGTLQLQNRIRGFSQRTVLKVNNIISENKIHFAARDQLQQDTKQGEKKKVKNALPPGLFIIYTPLCLDKLLLERVGRK